MLAFCQHNEVILQKKWLHGCFTDSVEFPVWKYFSPVLWSTTKQAKTLQLEWIKWELNAEIIGKHPVWKCALIAVKRLDYELEISIAW